MSSLLEVMYPGSFRGAEFLIQSQSVVGGRKTAIHEFPNSDSSDVEDLGLLNRTFTIEGLIHGSDSGYYFRRDNLIAQLTKPGKGVLSHPYEGSIEVTPLTYTKNETLAEINVCRFTMTFRESQVNPSAEEVLGTVSEIYDQADQALDLIDDDVISTFVVSTEFPDNFNDAYAKISDISSEVGISLGKVNIDNNYINELFAQQTQFNATATQATTNPTLLASNINSLFLAANNAASMPEDGFKFSQNLFDFGSDDLIINFDTIQYEERLKNRDILNSTVQFYALVYAFQNAVVITYTTDVQIRNVVQILNDQFKKVYQSQVLSDETLDQLAELRLTMAEFFANAEVNAFKLTPITTQTIPITVLTYQYYGNIDQVDNLISVNNLEDISFVKGTINILTQ